MSAIETLATKAAWFQLIVPYAPDIGTQRVAISVRAHHPINEIARLCVGHTIEDVAKQALEYVKKAPPPRKYPSTPVRPATGPSAASPKKLKLKKPTPQPTKKLRIKK